MGRIFFAPVRIHAGPSVMGSRTPVLRVEKSAYRSPNTLAYVERFIRTVRQECVDYFVVFGERHLNYLLSELVAHYHAERPHQGLDNEPLARPATAKRPEARKRSKPATGDLVPLSAIGCQTRLGGLLRHYYRKAA
jgi:putative transposase